MNQIKRVGKMLAVTLVLSMVVQLAIPNSFAVAAKAATTKAATTKAAAIAIAPQKVTLEVGKSKTLQITGTKAKAVWASSDAKVAVVSKTGKVTAKKAGKATITATISKKKYTCAVTVTETKKSNPLVDAAPFKAQAATTDKFTYIFPSSWSKNETDAGQYKQVYMAPTSAITTGDSSSVALIIVNLKNPVDAETLKTVYQQVTPDMLVSQYAQAGIDVTVDNLTVNTYDNTFGLGYVTQFDITYNGQTANQKIYEIYTDKYEFTIKVTDIGDKLSPDVNDVADYLLKTITISK